MQRILNNPDNIVDEMLEGFLKAHSDIVETTENSRVVKAKNIPEGKVGVITGGGSGHKPAFIGYVGKNLCDAAAVGEICSSPTAVAFLDAAKAADQGKGVACLYGNYSGDNMNVKMAKAMAEDEGIQVRYVTANDDISSSPKETKEKRHGIAGGVYMWKIAGAAAAQGADLDEVCRIAEKTVEHTRSICIGLAPCTIPDVGHPNFTIQEGTYEFGIGHHGEPGMDIRPMASAKEIAGEMMNAIHEDYELMEGDEVSIIVSGLGATPLMEQYILYKEAVDWLKERGIRIHHPLVGNYVTSLDMNGAAITVLKLDEELKKLLDVPAICAAFQFI